jgi:DNA-directed RNA polymerase specialized sigma subunit, sigma24 homolog
MKGWAVSKKVPHFRRGYILLLIIIASTICAQRRNCITPTGTTATRFREIIDEQDDETAQISYEELMNALEKIHPEEKTLIMMKYHDNISIKEIAEALRVSESAAKMRLKRAKARILFIIKESNEQIK